MTPFSAPATHAGNSMLHSSKAMRSPLASGRLFTFNIEHSPGNNDYFLFYTGYNPFNEVWRKMLNCQIIFTQISHIGHATVFGERAYPHRKEHTISA
jgi:hypothetical protein